MPKAAKNSKLGRVARRLAAGHPLPLSITKDVGRGQQEEEPDAPGKQDLSRGQKRRLAKREQYVKREKMILTSLKLKSQEEQKGRIDGLDAIREALVGTTRDAGKVEKKEPVNTSTHKSNKGKQRLLAEEVHHMGLVLEHPEFQADPFEAMQEHLRNTLAQEREQMELKAQERSKEERRKQEQLKQEKKDRLQGVKKSKKRFKATRSKK